MLAMHLRRLQTPLRFAIDPVGSLALQQHQPVPGIDLQYQQHQDPRTRAAALWAQSLLASIRPRLFNQAPYDPIPPELRNTDDAEFKRGLPNPPTSTAQSAGMIRLGNPADIEKMLHDIRQGSYQTFFNGLPNPLGQQAQALIDHALNRGDVHGRLQGWPDDHPLIQAFMQGTQGAAAGDEAARRLLQDAPHYRNGQGIPGHWQTPVYPGATPYMHSLHHNYDTADDLGWLMDHLHGRGMGHALLQPLRQGVHTGDLQSLLHAMHTANAVSLGGGVHERPLTPASYAGAQRPNTRKVYPGLLGSELADSLHPAVVANYTTRNQGPV